jgi:hypothetical protein
MYSIETDGKDTELIKATAEKWAQLLNLNAGEFIIRVEPGGHNCYYYGGDKIEISVSPLFDEYLLAHELAHVAMGQKIDLCFSQFIFSKKLKMDDEKDNLFMRQVSTAGRQQDMWVDDLLYQIAPDLVLQDMREDLPHISFLANNPDKAKEALSLGLSGLDFYTYLSLNKGCILRRGVESDLSLIVEMIDSLSEALGEDFTNRLCVMVDLVAKSPGLPEDKVGAVSIFGSTVQKVCKLFNFPKPALVYDNKLGCHVWDW